MNYNFGTLVDSSKQQFVYNEAVRTLAYAVDEDLIYKGFILYWNDKPILAYNGTRNRLYLKRANRRSRNSYVDGGTNVNHYSHNVLLIFK